MNVENKTNQSNKRMFKHLLIEKEELSSPIRMAPYPKISDFLLKAAPDIPETDYEEENDDNMLILKSVYKNVNPVDLWENAERHSNVKVDDRKCTELKHPTNTLREAFKHRPPVTEYIKEITRANKENIEKRKQREHNKLTNKDVEESENEAQQIYREILKVVGANSPTSLPVSRGSMVGFSEQAEEEVKGQRDERSTKPNQIDEQIPRKIR